MMDFRDHIVHKFVLKTAVFATQEFALSVNQTFTFQTVFVFLIIYFVRLDHSMVNAISVLMIYHTYQIASGAFHFIQFMIKIGSFT
jgi:hypothetical protein